MLPSHIVLGVCQLVATTPGPKKRVAASKRPSSALNLGCTLMINTLATITLTLVLALHQQATCELSGDGFRETWPESGPLALAFASNAEEKPRLIPLVASDSGYSENSSVNILCTVSQGHHESLTFDWFKDGQLLTDSELSGYNRQAHSGPQIEKSSDHSLLRISRIQSKQAGRYTCKAQSLFGIDSSSVDLIVNVKLHWTLEPKDVVVVSSNQELKVDCLAEGEPKPSMRWEKLDTSSSMLPRFRQQPLLPSSPSMTSGPSTTASALTTATATTSKKQLAVSASSNGYRLTQAGDGLQMQNNVLVSSNGHLSIPRAKESDSGLYQCIASNNRDTELRKLIHVQVRG